MSFYVGTSGYSYKAWKGSFYPEKLSDKQMLRFYGERFRTVEINYTFNRLPATSVFEDWACQVPADFRFVLKAPRQITHMRRLANVSDLVSSLLTTAGTLEQRLGPLLFQLPPNFKKNVPLLRAFLALLTPERRAAMEFRHPSWFDDEVFAVLRDHHAALCLADADDELEVPFVATAGWGFLRLRQTDYDDTALKTWVNRIRAQDWQDCFVFFKHEETGKGPQLAERLLKLLAVGSQPSEQIRSSSVSDRSRAARRTSSSASSPAPDGSRQTEPPRANIVHRVRLIHWNVGEAEQTSSQLRITGYEVVHERLDGAKGLRLLRENPPSAVVIDLSRLPMQGRDVGVALRSYKATRSVPLIFVDGTPDKVARVQQSLPDATYTTWDQIGTALREAIANPRPVTMTHRSVLSGYSGTPLAKKLGIKRDAVVALVGAPSGFEDLLGEVPEGVIFHRHGKGQRHLTIWFTRTSRDLGRGIERMALVAEQGPLWIVWPKQASPLRSDLKETTVRKVGLANGLVDYKVCSVDANWSGLLFARRAAK